MSQVNLAGLAAVLKYLYKPLIKTINNMRVLLDLVEKRTESDSTKGYQLWIPSHTGRNQGVGARIVANTTYSGTGLPTPTGQTYAYGLWQAVYQYGVISLTGQALRLVKGGAGSSLDALRGEVEGIAEDVAKDLNRQYWHDGSGVLTQCANSSSNALDVSSTKFLSPGMVVDVRQGTDGAHLSGESPATISTVDSATAVTMTSATGNVTSETTGYFVFRTNTRMPTAEGGTWANPVEAWGLESLIRENTNATTGGLGVNPGGIDRSASAGEYFRSKVLGNSAVLRDLTPSLMQQAFDEMTKWSGKRFTAKNAVILTNYELQRLYGTYLTADRRFVSSGGRMKLDAGWEGLDFNGVPVIADPDASLTATPGYLRRMYFIDLTQLVEFVPVDWTWINTEQGGPKIDWIQGYDAYIAAMTSYRNLVIKNPKSCCILDDLKES